jgi:hypothetical protein
MTSNDKLDLSINNESQFSATSNDDVQQGGFFGLFGSNKEALITDMALDALNERKIKECVFLLSNAVKRNLDLDLSKHDSNDRNLLHLLVLYSAYDIEIKDLLIKLLNRSDIGKYINCQDKHKNTPAHYALSLNLIDILKLLVSKNADLTIKNDQGYFITLNKSPVDLKSQEVKSPEDTLIDDIAKSLDIVSPIDITPKKLSNIFIKCDSDKASKGKHYTSQEDKLLESIVHSFILKPSTSDDLTFDRNDL